MLLPAHTFSTLWSPLWTNNAAAVIANSAVTETTPDQTPADPATSEQKQPEPLNFLLVVKGEAPFDTRELSAGIKSDPDFSHLQLAIAEDETFADAVLEVGRAKSDGEFSVELRSTETGAVLLSAKIHSPDGDLPNATKMAAELVRVLQPWRLGRNGGRA